MKTKFKEAGWMIALAFVCLVGLWQINAYAELVSNSSFETGQLDPEWRAYSPYPHLSEATVELANDAPDGDYVVRIPYLGGIARGLTAWGWIHLTGINDAEFSVYVKSTDGTLTYVQIGLYYEGTSSPIWLDSMSVGDRWTKFSKIVDLSDRPGSELDLANIVIYNLGRATLGDYRGSDLLIDLVSIDLPGALAAANACINNINAHLGTEECDVATLPLIYIEPGTIHNQKGIARNPNKGTAALLVAPGPK